MIQFHSHTVLIPHIFSTWPPWEHSQWTKKQLPGTKCLARKKMCKTKTWEYPQLHTFHLCCAEFVMFAAWGGGIATRKKSYKEKKIRVQGKLTESISPIGLLRMKSSRSDWFVTTIVHRIWTKSYGAKQKSMQKRRVSFHHITSALDMAAIVSLVYLLHTYGVHIHKARHSALAYLITRYPFTPSLGCK